MRKLLFVSLFLTNTIVIVALPKNKIFNGEGFSVEYPDDWQLRYVGNRPHLFPPDGGAFMELWTSSIDSAMTACTFLNDVIAKADRGPNLLPEAEQRASQAEIKRLGVSDTCYGSYSSKTKDNIEIRARAEVFLDKGKVWLLFSQVDPPFAKKKILTLRSISKSIVLKIDSSDINSRSVGAATLWGGYNYVPSAAAGSTANASVSNGGFAGGLEGWWGHGFQYGGGFYFMQGYSFKYTLLGKEYSYSSTYLPVTGAIRYVTESGFYVGAAAGGAYARVRSSSTETTENLYFLAEGKFGLIIDLWKNPYDARKKVSLDILGRYYFLADGASTNGWIFGAGVSFSGL